MSDSHVYLGIIGWKRGSVIADLKKSYVKFEYELARDRPLPILVYLTDPDVPVPPSQMEEGRRRYEVERLRKDIQREQRFVWKHFANTIDLVLEVCESLYKLLSNTEHFKALPDSDKLILELRQVIEEDFIARLNEIRHAQLLGGREEGTRKWFLPSLARCNLGDRYISRDSVRQQVSDWLLTGRTRFLFLVGPSGIGKTNFLLDLILRTHCEQLPLKRHALLMLPLGSYDPEQTFISNVHAFVNRSGRMTASVGASILSQLIEDGRVILILDGLDEFARQHGESACEQLFDALNKDLPTQRVLVSCRDHILRRLEGRSLNRGLSVTKISVPPLEPEEVRTALESRMGRESVPFRVAIMHNALLKFAENPLLFEMMCEMSNRSWRHLIESGSIGRVYELWFDDAIDAAAGVDGPLDQNVIEEARLKLGRVARTMLQHRSDLISSGDLEVVHLPVGCLRVQGQPFGILIQETPDEWGFVHDSFRDFAIAKSVATELTTQKYELLASTRLDYVGAEMYRFLRDLLSKDQELFAQCVDDALSAIIADRDIRNYLVSNCFEAIGMIASDSQADHFIEKGIGILSNAANVTARQELSGEAVCNILRCLERLHDSAPRPYIDDVITREWGGKPSRKRFGAWALRGFQRTERGIGSYPPMTFERQTIDRSVRRQKEISAFLLSLLRNMTWVDPGWLHYVAVNCTFALIRWLHPSHVGDLLDILSRYRNQQDLAAALGPEGRANLFLALTRFGDSNALKGTSDHFAGMKLNFAYLSRDMIGNSGFVFRQVSFLHKETVFDQLDTGDRTTFEDCTFPY